MFGILMIFPSLSIMFSSLTVDVADLGQSVQGKSALVGSGFWSGFILGMALGLVWTPCAGPILAAVTVLVATSAVTWSTFFLTLSYSLGAAIPMILIIYGGKGLACASGLSNYTEEIRKGFGCLMILAALAISLHYDVAFQQIAIQYVPLINIENNTLVNEQLDKLRDAGSSTTSRLFIQPIQAPKTDSEGALPKIAAVPELAGITGWVNTEPFTFQQLRGKVVLVNFWTYSCINCIRTFPHLKEWYAKYKDRGLVIVGVHTPEFEFEKDSDNVREAVKRFGLLYPIAIDSRYETWQNFGNRFWPAHYLIDQNGIVRSVHFGEGAYVQTENEIRTLLGLSPLKEHEKSVIQRLMTPETYLGFERADRYTPENVIQPDANADYNFHTSLKDDQFGLKGLWLVSSEKITAVGDNDTLDLNFLATDVYLVMESATPQLVTVDLDGNPLEKKYTTDDMNDNGQILVWKPRKYDVIDLRNAYGRYQLTLHVPRGVSLYAFTFGNESN